MDYLKDLNEKQREAALHTEGPLLIVAGAGTGKTKTLTYRMLHLIKQGIPPESILAVTFTNKAAQEMRERVTTLIGSSIRFAGDEIRAPFVRTFHSLSVHILRNHGHLLGLPRYFTILDQDDARDLIKDAMKELSIDPKLHEPRKIGSIISRSKGNLMTPDTYETAVYSQTTDLARNIWERYEKLLKDMNAVDFDDLLVKTYRLLEKHPEVLKEYQNLWRYLHIDEYQDTNTVQYRLARLLSEGHKNICAVGDGDQNIYSWRGADLRNILNFEKDFPGAHIVKLEKNYRSTKNILAAADQVIRKNKGRIDKTLFTDNKEGEKISIYQAFSEMDEAYMVAGKAREYIRKGVSPDEIAVLFRTNFQSRAMEEAFLAEGVPYQVLGVRFFERREVKDIMSYLRAARNPKSFADIKRIINTPKRGIGKASIVKIFAGDEATLPAKMRERYNEFQQLLGRIAEFSKKNSPSETIKFIIKFSGVEKMLQDGGEDDSERLANLGELVTYATRYDTFPTDEKALEGAPSGIEKFLEDVALLSDQDSLNEKKNRKAVKLMTVHAAKGLEFKHVFVVGLEQGLFPTEREGRDDKEEERRLFYVAVTRAKETLFLSYAQMRRIYGQERVEAPSEFLHDIPTHLLQEVEKEYSEPIKTVYLDF